MISPKVAFMPRERARLLSRISDAPVTKRKAHAAFVAKSAVTMKQLRRVTALVKTLLDEEVVTDEALEAAIEVAFHHALRARVAFARSLAEEVLHRAGSRVLLSGRAHVVLAYVAFLESERREHVGTKAVLRAGLRHAERAIELFDRPVFGDRFFLCQARNNKAMILRALEEYAAAIREYRAVEAYFRRGDRNLYIAALNNRAWAHHLCGRNKVALRIVRKARKLSDKGKRHTYRGHILRTEATILGALGAPAVQREKLLRSARRLPGVWAEGRRAGRDS